jgi:hypothetical protein
MYREEKKGKVTKTTTKKKSTKINFLCSNNEATNERLVLLFVFLIFDSFVETNPKTYFFFIFFGC